MFTIVAAPQPAPPFHSLVRAAVTNLDGEAGWERGLTYAPETLGGYNALAACSAETVEHPLDDPPGVVDYEPWLLQVEHPCRSMTGYDGPAIDAELRRALDATESYAIARELWLGEVTRQVETAGDRDRRNLSLTDGPEVLNAGTPLSPKRALGLLQQALGDSLRGGRAMIHTAREVEPQLTDLTREGNLLTTRLGNLVVADAGYTGTPPDGEVAADGVGWLYGTGMVVVRRGAVRVDGPEAEVVDLATNTPLRRIDRPVAATFDKTAHYAVAVTLS